MMATTRLGDSLSRLQHAADAALQAPLDNEAWDVLARVIAAEHPVLSIPTEIDEIDSVRNRIVGDAECVRASLAAVRSLGKGATSAALRRPAKYCRNMRGEVERLSLALPRLKAGSPGYAIAER